MTITANSPSVYCMHQVLAQVYYISVSPILEVTEHRCCVLEYMRYSSVIAVQHALGREYLKEREFQGLCFPTGGDTLLLKCSHSFEWWSSDSLDWGWPSLDPFRPISRDLTFCDFFCNTMTFCDTMTLQYVRNKLNNNLDVCRVTHTAFVTYTENLVSLWFFLSITHICTVIRLDLYIPFWKRMNRQEPCIWQST